MKLGGDIGTAQNPITRMAGSSKHDFCGTFDGQGYTLYVNISSDDREYTAPFSYISNVNSSPATIRNLNVGGTVTATKDYAGGIVGAFWGTLTIENCASSVAINTNNKHAAGFISRAQGSATIRNCLSSVAITGTISGDGTHAGFIGGSSNGVTTTIEGCAFTGSMLGSTTTHCAGFVGYNSGTLTISNSLFAPTEVTVGATSSATFARGNEPTITNSYYTQTLGTEQGKQARSITAGENVTVSHAGEAMTYTVSGITAYKATGASSDSDPFIAGIVYDGVLYAGSNDEVSLTLSHAERVGYTFSGYTASAGTLVGSTLTMPDADVTIAALWEEMPGITLTIGSSGWATWYDTKSYTLSSGATAYYVSSVGDGVVHLTAIDGGVPANVPVLINGSGKVTLTAAATAVEVNGNDPQFKGTATALSAADFTDFVFGRTYVLYGGKFMLVETNGGIGAHKCWLTLSSNGARQMRISIDDATAMYDVPCTMYNSDDAWYDLRGRKLSGEPTKHGIYIYKSKKVEL